MHTVRTTINPEVEVEVSDAEFTDLERWGLVVKSQATTPEGLRRAAAKQVAANTEKEDDQ